MDPANSRRIPRVPRYSGCHQAPSAFAYRIVTFYDETFQTLPLCVRMPPRGPITPCLRCHRRGLGSSPFARHYWGNHMLFSSPGGTKMFQFPPFASLHKSRDNYPSGNWVVPFGNRGITGHLHLPRAYRSLSRPSSPPGAKASTRRPNSVSPILLEYSPYFQLY